MNTLLEAAKTARAAAYCPYSGYAVGASVRAEDGTVHAGCNVENASYGLTVCAERNAIAAMVAAGHKRFTEVLILTRDGGSPCGACLQVLAEFGDADATVHVVAENGAVRTMKLGSSLPQPFAL
jgi:cytidine deaminase